MSATITVELPRGLCQLAGAPAAIQVTVEGPLTQRSIIDAVEQRYPMLEGTIRDHTTRLRRPFIRFFVAEEDLSHLGPDDALPHARELADGREPFLIVGAIAGGSGAA